MSLPFRIIDYESLDFLELSTGLEASGAGPTGPTGISAISTGPNGAQGATGATGATGSAASSPSLAIFYNSSGSLGSGTRYLRPNTSSTSEAFSEVLFPVAGQLTQLTVSHNTVPAGTWTYTARINSVNTALTLTSAVSGATTFSTNVGFNAGDRLTLQGTSASAGSVTQATIVYTIV